MDEKKIETIKTLKNLLFKEYGITLKEDDPAWLMILIYNDLMGNTNKALKELNHIPFVSKKNEEILKTLSALQIKTSSTFENLDNISDKIVKQTEAFLEKKNEGYKLLLSSSAKTYEEKTKDFTDDIKDGLSKAMVGFVKTIKKTIDDTKLVKKIEEEMDNIAIGIKEKFDVLGTVSNGILYRISEKYEDSVLLEKEVRGKLEEVDNLSKSITHRTSETAELMEEQIKVLNKYTKKANLFDYMMVFILTTVAWGGIMFHYVPDAVKGFIRSMLKGVML